MLHVHLIESCNELTEWNLKLKLAAGERLWEKIYNICSCPRFITWYSPSFFNHTDIKIKYFMKYSCNRRSLMCDRKYKFFEYQFYVSTKRTFLRQVIKLKLLMMMMIILLLLIHTCDICLISSGYSNIKVSHHIKHFRIVVLCDVYNFSWRLK